MELTAKSAIFGITRGKPMKKGGMHPLAQAARKLSRDSGMSELISMIVVISFLALFAGAGISMWGQMVKLDDLQQMAQSMARTIALEGKVDGNTYARLSELERLMRMDVDMRVEGDFIVGTDKLKLESDFTVHITYQTKYGVGWIEWGKERTYEARAKGTAEEYYK